MQTITIPKNQYEVLKRKASLYEEFLKLAPEKIFGIESYSSRRIKDFLKLDKIDTKTAKQLKRLLKS